MSLSVLSLSLSFSVHVHVTCTRSHHTHRLKQDVKSLNKVTGSSSCDSADINEVTSDMLTFQSVHCTIWMVPTTIIAHLQTYAHKFMLASTPTPLTIDYGQYYQGAHIFLVLYQDTL